MSAASKSVEVAYSGFHLTHSIHCLSGLYGCAFCLRHDIREEKYSHSLGYPKM